MPQSTPPNPIAPRILSIGTLLVFSLLGCSSEEAADACYGAKCVDTVGSCAPEKQLYINELVAKNKKGLRDESGKYADWLEIYNASDQAVDLAGKYLSDDVDIPTQSKILSTDSKATTIDAGGYLVLWADKDEEDGILHLNFKLSGDGDSVFLYESDGITLIDSVEFGAQKNDISFGRATDGCEAWTLFDTPTPGSANK